MILYTYEVYNIVTIQMPIWMSIHYGINDILVLVYNIYDPVHIWSCNIASNFASKLVMGFVADFSNTRPVLLPQLNMLLV